MSIYQERIAAVRAQLAAWNVDGVLITSATNRRWLTGFPGSAGMALVTAETAVLATDGRYWTVVAEQCPDVTLYRYTRTAEALEQFIAAEGRPRLGLEGQHVTVAQFEHLQKAEGVQWTNLDGRVDVLREVKNAAEIAQIRAAAAITDRAMQQVPHLARPGVTEQALAWELEKFMREAGAEALAFTPIVAAGPHGARPHHEPSARPLQVGDAITVDIGARVGGYHSDMTRTFHLGSAPEPRFWEIFNLVRTAEETAIARMRPGMTGAAVDALARDVIAQAGYGDFFLHSLGHGVGLQIHEGPSLSQFNPDGLLPVGAVVTVEPGIYLPDWSGVRIEDLVLVTPDGAELLSHCPKEPLIHA